MNSCFRLSTRDEAGVPIGGEPKRQTKDIVDRKAEASSRPDESREQPLAEKP